MRINPKDKLYDQPILKIREILRHAMQERFFESTKPLIIAEISKILLQSTAVSEQIVEQLIRDQYLILKEVTAANTLHYELVATDKGRRFGIATANTAITRQKADELLNDLIERAKTINANDDLVYVVERIKVFGSYLSNKELLGDLDVAVKLTRKYEGIDFTNRNQKRIITASQNGRKFSSYMDQISFPHTEVMLMLKTKKKGLSLHDEDTDEIIKITKTTLVYEYIKPTGE